MPFTVIIVRLKGVLSNKLLKIYNPGHVIRGNGFLYLCIIEKESERFAGEGIAFYPCDHGKMGRYKIPQANAGFLCIVAVSYTHLDVYKRQVRRTGTGLRHHHP